MKRLPSLLLALVLSASCAHDESAGGDELMHGSVRAPDGVRIVYDALGRGDPALLFVHCWCGDRSFWRHQIPELARDHRVVALDLAGHGASGRDRREWTLASLAEDVQAVADAERLDRFVLVGHSMGGPVALEVARRLPGRVLAVIGVDTLVDVEIQVPEEQREAFMQAFEADFEGTLRNFVGTMFAEDADPALAESVIQQALATDRTAALALMRALTAHDLRAAFAAAKVPIRCINAAPRPPWNFTTNVAGNRRYADFDAVIMEGVGHYLQLERPAEFNARLREVLAALPPR